ncbi:MAG: hypothetical protein KDH88_02290 [Chromatiales bacterium]|nr:hypothetical protein [Chromatiales bacterium]
MENLLKKKIAITLVFWCLPLLLFPGGWFVQVGFPAPEPLLFVRLLGAAYAALVAGYIDGLKGIAAGKDPTPTLRMGVCSNGLAFVILLGTGIRGEWGEWGIGAQIFLWLSTAGTLSIAVQLLHYWRQLAGRDLPAE